MIIIIKVYQIGQIKRPNEIIQAINHQKIMANK